MSLLIRSLKAMIRIWEAFCEVNEVSLGLPWFTMNIISKITSMNKNLYDLTLLSIYLIPLLEHSPCTYYHYSQASKVFVSFYGYSHENILVKWLQKKLPSCLCVFWCTTMWFNVYCVWHKFWIIHLKRKTHIKMFLTWFNILHWSYYYNWYFQL